MFPSRDFLWTKMNNYQGLFSSSVREWCLGVHFNGNSSFCSCQVHHRWCKLLEQDGLGRAAQHRIAAEDFRAALQNPLVLQESWRGCSIKGGQSACVAQGQHINLI